MAGLNGNARFSISFAVQTMRMTWTFFSVFGQFQIQRIWVDIGCNTTGNSMLHIATPSKEFTWFAAGLLPDLRGRRRRRGLRYTRLGKKFRSESAASRSRDTNRAFEVTRQYWGTFIAKPVPVIDIIERWKGDTVLLRCVITPVAYELVPKHCISVKVTAILLPKCLSIRWWLHHSIPQLQNRLGTESPPLKLLSGVGFKTVFVGLVNFQFSSGNYST